MLHFLGTITLLGGKIKISLYKTLVTAYSNPKLHKGHPLFLYIINSNLEN